MRFDNFKVGYPELSEEGVNNIKENVSASFTSSDKDLYDVMTIVERLDEYASENGNDFLSQSDLDLIEKAEEKGINYILI